MGKNVRIRVDIRRIQTPDSGQSAETEQPTVQQVQGKLYERGDALYIRYPETGPGMGRTMTTVKISRDGIRITRQGDTVSEMDFIPGRSASGRIHSIGGPLRLKTYTHSLNNQLAAGKGSAAWGYDVYVEEQWSGRFEAVIAVTPASGP